MWRSKLSAIPIEIQDPHEHEHRGSIRAISPAPLAVPAGEHEPGLNPTDRAVSLLTIYVILVLILGSVAFAVARLVGTLPAVRQL